MLPPNATSIMQPLDQGIILSAKRRYKKKLAERYLACVENVFFRGRGVVKLNYVLFFKWGGHKSRHKTMYHMCKTWLEEVHSGWEMGGGVTFK